MKRPTVSVVLAVHNGEPFLRETLESVRNQTYSDWECIVINDFSTDNTAAILNEYAQADDRFKIHSNEVNLRLAKSLNVGLELAQGKYIVRLDADDLQLPCRFEKQVAFMEAHPDVALSYPMHYTLKDGILTTGSCGRYKSSAAVEAMMLFFCPVLHPAVIVKREVIVKYQYNAEFTCSEDMELWSRMIAAGEKLVCQNEFLFVYRLHGGQITANTKDKAKVEVARILKTYYRNMLGLEDDSFVDTYMQRCYFHDNDNLDLLIDIYRTVIQHNRKSKKLSNKMIRYAVIELLCEMKRIHGLPKRQWIHLLRLGGPAFVWEFCLRKKRTSIDLQKSIVSAEEAGYSLVTKLNGSIPTFISEVSNHV